MSNILLSITGKSSSEELIAKWGKENVVLEAKGFFNEKENIFGIYIHDPKNPGEIIDIYLQKENQEQI